MSALYENRYVLRKPATPREWYTGEFDVIERWYVADTLSDTGRWYTTRREARNERDRLNAEWREAVRNLARRLQ